MHDDGDRARVRLHEGADPRRAVRGRRAHQRGRRRRGRQAQPHAGARGVPAAGVRGPAAAVPQARRARRPGLGRRGRERHGDPAARRAPRDREGHRARTEVRRAPASARSPTRRTSPGASDARRSSRPTAGSIASTSPPPATRSCSRSTTRCATARAGWASRRIARDEDRTRQILDEHRALARAVGRSTRPGALAVLDAHLGTTLALLRAAPGERSGELGRRGRPGRGRRRRGDRPVGPPRVHDPGHAGRRVERQDEVVEDVEPDARGRAR